MFSSTIVFLSTVMTMMASSTAGHESELLSFQLNDGRPTVVRNYISEEVASQLYADLRVVGFPTSKDDEVHPSLVSTHGHAGGSLDGMLPPPYQALEEVYKSGSQQSVVLRMEHMTEHVYDQSKGLVNEVAPNNVMEEGGTVHLYVSSPGASALDNHTDTTDIVVLHLDGAKEWLLCEEREEDTDDPFVFSLTHKLSSCSTYEKKEIDTLKCYRTILNPGDALHLPKRVVHSAQAVSKRSLSPSHLWLCQ